MIWFIIHSIFVVEAKMFDETNVSLITAENIHLELESPVFLLTFCEFPCLEYAKSIYDYQKWNSEQEVLLNVCPMNYSCTKPNEYGLCHTSFLFIIKCPYQNSTNGFFDNSRCFIKKMDKISNYVCSSLQNNSSKTLCSVDETKWANLKNLCPKLVPKPAVTDKLLYLLEQSENISTELIVKVLLDITETFGNFSYTDVFLMGKILEIISSVGENIDFKNVTVILSNIMNIDNHVLSDAQYFLNATDNILKVYDEILKNVQIDSYEIVSVQNLLLLIANVEKIKIKGLVLLSHNNTINATIIFEDPIINYVLENVDLEAAIFIDSILQQNCSKYSNHLILTAFFRSSLFNENFNRKTYVNGTIFGLILPQSCKKCESPVSMVFKPFDLSGYSKTCSHWKFSDGNYKSHWSDSGFIGSKNSLITCEFWHTTHFSLVLSDTKYAFNSVLFMGSVNSVISFISLMGIYVTAILFEDWRKNTGNQILLNISLSMSLQIIFLSISYWVHSNNISHVMCKILGAVFHYFVLSEFCWMLVLGILQFRRFVIVLGGPTSNILLKSCLVGWGLPLLPIAILLSLHANYDEDHSIFCYPSNTGMFLVVLLPICLIILTNSCIFVAIVYEICRLKPGGSRYDIYHKWKTIVILFFTLGVTWLFGFIAIFDTGTFFTYLFCFLSSLQGFMVFLFFILFNDYTKSLYKKLFKQLYQKYFK